MMAPHNPAAERVTATARVLYQQLIALDMKAAEDAIEDARKILWVSHFSGSPRSAVVELYARAPIAGTLASDLEGRSLLEIEAILQELRFALYVNAYGCLENTRFGAALKAHLEDERDGFGPIVRQ